MLRKPWSDQENEQCRDQAGSGGAKLGAVILELPTLAPKTPDLAPMRGRAGNHILVLCASASIYMQVLYSPIRAESQASGWRTEKERCWQSSELHSSGSMPCIHERMARVRLVVEQQLEQQSSVAPTCRHSRAILAWSRLPHYRGRFGSLAAAYRHYASSFRES